MSTLLYPPSLGRHFRRGRFSSLVGAVAAFGQLLSGNCSRATNSGRGWHGTWRTQDQTPAPTGEEAATAVGSLYLAQGEPSVTGACRCGRWRASTGAPAAGAGSADAR